MRGGPLAPLLRRLCLDYMERLSVEEAAAECGLSRGHFCRAFKKATGRTFVEYLNTLRLIEAERLLADTERPVREVALEVGFEDPAYFARLFRAMRGMTPGEARGRARTAAISPGSPAPGAAARD